jgi:hypothetical protein
MTMQCKIDTWRRVRDATVPTLHKLIGEEITNGLA